MKSVSLTTLEGAIIKPGFEKRLTPLLYYRGKQNLGRVHRLWNFTVAGMVQECETAADFTQRLAHNPDYSHLLGPDAKPQHTSLGSFWSRLLDHPEVTGEVTGLRDYIRSLNFRYRRLDPVSPLSARSRCAPWRTFDAKMPAFRALQAERKEARRVLREAEAHARRVAREKHRSATRELKEAARSERRALLMAQRAARKLERDRAAREPKKFVLREQAAQISYPFLIHDGGRPEHALLRAVNAAVPRHIMGDLRADICQDLVVGILCGDFEQDDLTLPSKEIIKRVRKMFPEKYGPMSLDAILPGTDSLRLIDTI